MDIKNDIKLFLFDMDGTIYRGNRLFDFTKELLAEIRAQGKKYMFITNNSSKCVWDNIKKLEALGIDAEYRDFITAAQETALYLKETFPDKKLYVCGTESLKGELREYGLAVAQSLDEVDCVVMSSDTELTYKKINEVSYLLTTKDVLYVAATPDDVVPTEYGCVPDCGAFCDMLFKSTGKMPLFIGKPAPAMARRAMGWSECEPEETLLVGDRIDTDIMCGINAGCHTALVMTGDTSEETLAASEQKPQLVLSSAEEILQILKR